MAIRMLNEARVGFQLAIRSWRRTIAFSSMVALATGILTILLGDVLTQGQVYRAGVTLRSQGAVAFTAFYSSNSAIDSTDNALPILSNAIESGNAYTTLVNNIQIDNDSFADGFPVVIMVGDMPKELFPELNLCDPTPCAMHGAMLEGRELPSLRIAGDIIDKYDRLPRHAILFEPHAAGESLSNYILLRLDGSSLTKLDKFEQEEALTKAVLLDPSETKLTKYVSAASADNIYLVPDILDKSQSGRFTQLIIMSALYVTAVVAFLLLTIIGLLSAIRLTLSDHCSSSIIRRSYGATSLHMATRIGVFIALALWFPSALLIFFVAVVIGPSANGGWGILFALTIIAILMWWDANFRVSKQLRTGDIA